MSTNPMPDQSTDTEQDSRGYQQCEQEIESLEKRVAACEAKLGIQSPPDEAEPDGLAEAIQGSSNPFLKAKSL